MVETKSKNTHTVHKSFNGTVSRARHMGTKLSNGERIFVFFKFRLGFSYCQFIFLLHFLGVCLEHTTNQPCLQSSVKHSKYPVYVTTWLYVLFNIILLFFELFRRCMFQFRRNTVIVYTRFFLGWYIWIWLCLQTTPWKSVRPKYGRPGVWFPVAQYQIRKTCY